jgi:hypothetical protein
MILLSSFILTMVGLRGGLIFSPPLRVARFPQKHGRFGITFLKRNCGGFGGLCIHPKKDGRFFGFSPFDHHIVFKRTPRCINNPQN